ncbi:MAG: prepilin-type N-terminal cleavage/methylation domain-containing protein [Phycisphaerales bacterium]|nr:prepilin-type N-terminal cleavage/methylation domain-containing protein [Phycisphaerales bacterium]
MHTTRTQTLAKGFTLTELLVVISIIVLLVAIAVPAFSTILYNNERAQAENQLRVGISSARDAAIASDGGDAAAVFIFRPGDRLLIIPAVMVGTIEDQVIVNGAPVGGTTTRTRDVFVPVATGEPIALPRGWSIRGFAPPGAIDAGTGIANGWYDALLSQPTGSETRGNWLFPESGYYDGSRANDGWKRQTFIVRFEARTGSLSVGSKNDCLIVDPVPNQAFRTAAPFSANRLDEASDQVQFVKRVISPANPLTPAQRQALLGDRSLDTILARPVTEIALVDERRMAAGLKAGGLNRATGSVYGVPGSGRDIPTEPRLDTDLFPATPDPAAISLAISQWIEGRLPDGPDFVASDARIFTMQRYLGQLKEVTP